MLIDNTTYVSQMGDLLTKYQKHCGAVCLFWLGAGGRYGVRIEAPFIAKQFIDDVHFGRGEAWS